MRNILRVPHQGQEIWTVNNVRTADIKSVEYIPAREYITMDELMIASVRLDTTIETIKSDLVGLTY